MDDSRSLRRALTKVVAEQNDNTVQMSSKLEQSMQDRIADTRRNRKVCFCWFCWVWTTQSTLRYDHTWALQSSKKCYSHRYPTVLAQLCDLLSQLQLYV